MSKSITIVQTGDQIHALNPHNLGIGESFNLLGRSIIGLLQQAVITNMEEYEFYAKYVESLDRMLESKMTKELYVNILKKSLNPNDAKGSELPTAT